MKATISVDHRVSDGAEAARFMQKLAEFLENPVRMLVYEVGWPLCVNVTISVDHRVSAGTEAARFMQKLVELLENPVRMLV